MRTAEGRQIRTAFVAAKGNKLVSADYSQIELRVLAHVANIPQLRQAFTDGLDIHAMTASEMFDVPIKDMDPAIRRRAKAINFGIIYGISAFGLANQLSIPREEAGQYIKTYFERFPGIRDYMESTKAFCRANGYVETVFGRRMHFPRIKSPNPSERAFQERAAINAPIQGSAADIIRRAMIRMPGALAGACRFIAPPREAFSRAARSLVTCPRWTGRASPYRGRSTRCLASLQIVSATSPSSPTSTMARPPSSITCSGSPGSSGSTRTWPTG